MDDSHSTDPWRPRPVDGAEFSQQHGATESGFTAPLDTASPAHHAHGAERRSRRSGTGLLIALVIVLFAAAALAGVGLRWAIWGDAAGNVIGSVTEPLIRDGADWPIGGGASTEQTAPSGNQAQPGLEATNGGLDVASIAAAVTPGIVDVNVTVAYSGSQAAGTGMVLSSSGLVLTNNHVIQGAGEISVRSVATDQVYAASVVGYDRSHDVALLQLENAADLATVTLGDSSEVEVGDSIVVIGNAGGDGGEPTSVAGVVAGLNREIVAMGPSGAEQLTGLIEVAADVQSGQSGGPTVNGQGEVIGITTAASGGYSFEESGGAGFAVPIQQALDIVAQIQRGVSVGSVHVGPTAFLGVQVVSSQAEDYGYGAPAGGQAIAGAVVSGVLPDTPAQSAGVQEGDVITGLDGSSISSASELTAALGLLDPGDTVEVTWIDPSGVEHGASVVLMAGPPS
ncbi:MAG: trypsin-like peptidase domain-containing protein [Thermoleophilia bacterium]